MYAHVPNVLGPDGKKLSKRHGATGVDELRAAGYYAPALLNFLALLGWSYDDKTTVMSRDELVERFTLDRVTKSPAVFDYEKLDWLNGVYLRALSSDAYADELVRWLARLRLRLGPGSRAPRRRRSSRRRSSDSPSFPSFAGFLFESVEVDAGALDGSAELLAAAAETVKALEPWSVEEIERRCAGSPRPTA